MALEQDLCARLETLARQLEDAVEEVSAETFLWIIEVTTMIESYYTPEQMEQLKARAGQVSEERMRQVPADWAALWADVGAAMNRGADPESPEVLALARRWQGLVDEFTGGDRGIEQSLRRLWDEQGPNLAAQFKMDDYDPRVFAFIGKALAVVKAS
jgi:hypothetical protein